MKKTVKLKTPLVDRIIKSLRAGDEVKLSGVIYTARDRAHKKLAGLLTANKTLPLDIKNAVIYYCGPTFCKGKLGSCGPTTASRMDNFLKPLAKAGLRATIGKGKRSYAVREIIKKHRGVYFVTYAGCAAYLSNFIKSYKAAAFPELGPEAIYEFNVVDFPLIVGIDAYGEDIYSDI
ncbi:MAG: hypothetical protein B1H08_02785 [Candidatus Omnitrophica bacterium 4484_171]|nr:MAG: hypothetical protein B1H08_02785 [Candidatus Omnitrophica bacterium 4484_171]